MVIRPRRLELPLWLIALGMLLRWLFRAVVWCVRHPVIVGLVVAGVWLYAEFGRAGLIVPLVLAGLVSALWRWKHETSWWTWCAGPVLGWDHRQAAAQMGPA
ncbi:hypothetical protein [Micromonospora palythoicola]|uniref:hypothetical protein n=1 Tax=Micromonospora palythoicola TaxID=3120507 RepID=UPI002FCE2183